MSEKSVVKIPENLVQAVQSARSVVLLTHVHPDGDALGSSLGFAEILDTMGKRVIAYFEEPISSLYRFLPARQRASYDIEEIHQFVAADPKGTIAIALDSGDDRRLGRHLDEFLAISPFLVIDHHRSHREYGETRWVEPTLSSTGEMIFELTQRLGGEISLDAAVNLYVAICTDTGSFRYDATSPRTHRIVAELIELGVKPDMVAQCLYDNLSLARMRLLQMVLSTLRVHEEGQLAFVHVTREMVSSSGATPHDIEGFVDYPRSLGTVKVAVFIKEADDDGLVSVSLRAKGELDVADVANGFNGGGHRNAAGFRLRGKSMEEVHAMVLDKLRARLINP